MSSQKLKRKLNSTTVNNSSESEDENFNEKCGPNNRENTRKRIKTNHVNKKSNTQNQKVSSLKLKIKESQTNSLCSKSNKVQEKNKFMYSENTNLKQWSFEELLSERESINLQSSKNIVQLFEKENTIPFIIRYRRDLIPNITAEKLRDIKTSFMDIINLQKRANTIVKQMEKDNQLNNQIKKELLCAKTIEELEFLYSPYKPANKGSLADRAKAIGLELHAKNIFYGKSPSFALESLMNPSIKGLDSLEIIFEGIKNIISHIISKNTEILEMLRQIQKKHRIFLKCNYTKNSSKQKLQSKNKTIKHCNDEKKYELYYNFENTVDNIKPHQILAINRAEKAKVLSVKIIVPDVIKNRIKSFIIKKILSFGFQYMLRSNIFEKSFEDCYTKKLQPLMCRQVRSYLNDKAKKASIEVFTKNLKQLLLISPLKGEKILGIDPGFTNGCKLAIISETTAVLETLVIYPHSSNKSIESGQKLAKLMIKHKCRIIALGNGTACRETEFWLSKLFEENILDPNIVKYSIVSEQGASIYSCSDIAKKEFPNLDVNLISAVSIARRLNDPLCEYVKIEAKHIGVGMYQHDINENILSESLNEVVMECVSFVGVDINTASISILKHISGLTESRADKIIKYRTKNGPFKTRKDLLKVNGVGEKTFTQCSGFIRIEPKSIGENIVNLLDCTWVHPESYTIAEKIISKLNLKLKDIGNLDFIKTIKTSASHNYVENLSIEFKLPKERILFIMESLQRGLFQDYRNELNNKPLFKQGISKMSDLKNGSLVSGAVTNVTHFGAFVDIGVEHDGLIHTCKMNGMILKIGDRVCADVIEIDIKRKRIQLNLQKVTI